MKPFLQAIGTTVAYGGTNIGDALFQARTWFTNASRVGSKRAVVLFTDGQPTAPTSTSYGNTHARSAATALKDMGIPIFTIGLAQTSSIIPGECNIRTICGLPSKILLGSSFR